jgi:hypothetical protein
MIFKNNFIIKLSLFTLTISIIAAFLYIFILRKYYITIFPFLIIFFFLINLVFHLLLIKASKERMAKFSSQFMLSMSLKLFLYIIFITIYLYLYSDNAVLFIANFSILYLVFTVFEISSLLSDLKENEKLKK